MRARVLLREPNWNEWAGQAGEGRPSVHCGGSGRLFDRYDGRAFGTLVLNSPDKTDPHLLARLGLGLSHITPTSSLPFGSTSMAQ
jgi:hypothetical protein